MLPTRAQSYTCWQCVYRSRARLVPRQAGAGAAVIASRSPSSTTSTTSRILLHQQTRHNHATASPGSSSSPSGGGIPPFTPGGPGPSSSSSPSSPTSFLPPLAARQGVKIRELLRQWEKDNAAVRFDQLTPDVSVHGSVSNMKNRAEVPENSELRQFTADSGGWQTEGDELVGESLVSGNIAEPGDLVEVRVPNSRLPVLAVYLGFRGANYHFYISTGQWRFTPTYTSHFSISRFADQKTVDSIMAAIPADGTTETFLEMERARQGPHRRTAGAILDRMGSFMQHAQAIYQEHISTLDDAFEAVAYQDRFRYVSLFDIAHRLLPTPDGELEPTALYAVHLALMRVDGGFRPVSSDTLGHKRDYLFEVSPISHMRIIETVEQLTRDHTKSVTAQVEKDDAVLKPAGGELPKSTVLAGFIRKARAFVKRSRASRPITKHAVLGPYAPGQKPTGVDSPADVSLSWTKEESEIMQFIEMWAAYRCFSPGSGLNSIASAILRFTECYEDILEVNPSVGWLFLQEVGWIPPWEIPARYKNRLPETAIKDGGSITRREVPGVGLSLRDDVAAGRRKDWGTTTVFCIDSKSTTLIDDGISLERTAKDDEFWMHVHVADPTSGIVPKSQLAKYIEAMPENVWLPGFHEEMLPMSDGETTPALAKEYSLAPGIKSLTFSARVTKGGDVLESRIEPGVLRTVLYLETDDVFTFCGEKEYESPGSKFSVGTPPAKEVAARKLTKTRDLSPSDKKDLETIGLLAQALHRKRKENGALAAFPPSPEIKVSMHATSRDNSTGQWRGDPYIELDWGTRDDVKVVSSPMQLAGEVAARWCHERGIPIPFRRETDGEANMAAAVEMIRDKLGPQLERGDRLTPTQSRELSALLGAVVDSVVPGPFVKTGLGLYTRATSPLRRFCDMLVHWQIHAALALEHSLGAGAGGKKKTTTKKLTPADVAANTAPRGLSPVSASTIPYSADELAPMLSLLSMRSQIVRRIHRGADEWILQALVRAWRFGQARVPPTFCFRVVDVGRHVLIGQIDFFARVAVMRLDGLDGVARIANVREGDLFEVALEDVNVHSRMIHVQALRRLG